MYQYYEFKILIVSSIIETAVSKKIFLNLKVSYFPSAFTKYYKELYFLVSTC